MCLYIECVQKKRTYYFQTAITPFKIDEITKAGHASSLRIPREKKCPADTINEFELHDSSWLWEDVS